jgi:hypothetical protein
MSQQDDRIKQSKPQHYFPHSVVTLLTGVDFHKNCCKIHYILRSGKELLKNINRRVISEFRKMGVKS